MASVCEAAVDVTGVRGWVKSAADRSLSAVYDSIPQHETEDVKVRLLRIVADRVLRGYTAREIEIRDDGASVELAPSSPEELVWSVNIVPPPLSPPVDAWFASDASGMEDEIGELMRGVPPEAALWGGDDLKLAVEALCGARLPGWRVSLLLRSTDESGVGARIMDVAFTAEQPLSLAVSSHISSTSVPVMLYSDLKKDLMKGLAPVIGLPVPWIEAHAEDMAVLAKSVLADEYLVEKGKLKAEVDVRTGSVSELDIELESSRYAARVWMAVYAGARDRYPEAGLHFGRRVLPVSGWELELYGELIVSLAEWEVETRLGLGWSPYKYLWIGGEWSSDEGMWWGRASYVPPSMRTPYVWARVSERGDANAALGLRITEYLSIEVHYDTRYEDQWNVRAVVNM